MRSLTGKQVNLGDNKNTKLLCELLRFACAVCALKKELVKILLDKKKI